MFKKSCVVTFLGTALFVCLAAFTSQAQPARTPSSEPAQRVFCTRIACFTTAQDCDPNGCGACQRTTGSAFGFCTNPL